MTVSQNGWPANRRDLVSSRYVPGTRVRLTVANGPAGDLLLEVAALFDLTVQDIDAGPVDDWGYAERPIRGSAAISNHASGTAIDLNATRWPLGSPASVNLDPARIAKVRAIVAATGGVVRWGGDYQGRKDPMHFEINDHRTPDDCARALEALRARFGRSATPREDDMTPEQDAMLREVHDELTKRLPNRRGEQGGELQGGGADTVLGYAANADGSGFRASWALAQIHDRIDELVTAVHAAPIGAAGLGVADPQAFAAAVMAALAERLGG